MATDPRFPPVQLLDPGPVHGSDNFQHVPTRPRVAPFGALERSPMFPQVHAPTAPGPQHAANVNDPHHYANLITGNFASPVVLAGGFLLIQRNDVRRNLLGLRNTAAAGGPNLLVDFGQPPSAVSWLVLTPGSLVLFDETVPQDDVWVNGSGAAWGVAFVYSTIPNNI